MLENLLEVASFACPVGVAMGFGFVEAVMVLNECLNIRINKNNSIS